MPLVLPPRRRRGIEKPQGGDMSMISFGSVAYTALAAYMLPFNHVIVCLLICVILGNASRGLICACTLPLFLGR